MVFRAFSDLKMYSEFISRLRACDSEFRIGPLGLRIQHAGFQLEMLPLGSQYSTLLIERSEFATIREGSAAHESRAGK